MLKERSFKQRLLGELYKYVTECELTRDQGIVLIFIHLLVHCLIIDTPEGFANLIFSSKFSNMLYHGFNFGINPIVILFTFINIWVTLRYEEKHSPLLKAASDVLGNIAVTLIFILEIVGLVTINQVITFFFVSKKYRENMGFQTFGVDTILVMYPLCLFSGISS